MQGTFRYDGSSSDLFPIKSRVKQGCVLAPTLFGIFFSLLLSYAEINKEEDGSFRLRSPPQKTVVSLTSHVYVINSKVQQAPIKDILFADDTTLTAPQPHCPPETLQLPCICMQGIWPNNQSQENQHQELRRQPHSKHHHW